jgi:hypothetical protein
MPLEWLSLDAVEFFHLTLEGCPVDTVFLLLGPHLGIQCFAQAGQVGCDHEWKEMAGGYHRGGFDWEANSKVEKAFCYARFPKPELDSMGIGLAGVWLIVPLHQRTDHGPILWALGFFRIDEVRNGKQVDFPSIRFSDRRSSALEHGKVRQVTELCHDIHPKTFDTGRLATVVDGVASIQDARVEARNGYPDGIQIAKRGVQTFKISSFARIKKQHLC